MTSQRRDDRVRHLSGARRAAEVCGAMLPAHKNRVHGVFDFVRDLVFADVI